MVQYAKSLVLAVLVVFSLANDAVADEATGRWSGRVEARTSFYREANTHVIAPTIGARLDAPSGVRVRGYYLADVVTSASVIIDVVAGASVSLDSRGRGAFSELRHEAGASVAGTVRAGDAELTIHGGARLSHEPDYYAYAGFLEGSVAFDQRNTVLGLMVTALHDEVRQKARTRDPITGETIVSIVRPSSGTNFDGFVIAASFEQLLNSRMILNGGYELGFLSGYLGNPYRRAQIEGRPGRENVPDHRLRHTPWVRLRIAMPRARGALHLLARGYADDWDTRALTLDGRWYQSIGRYLMMRVRYRYYDQNASFFDSGSQVSVPEYPFGTVYTTSNPRYAAMRVHEPGLALITRLGFFRPSSDSSLTNAELELSFDYRVADNRYGNAMFGAVALRLPFE